MCVQCYKLLYEPVTTPCGHSFCKDCFQRAMDHQPRCPLCRTVLHIARKVPGPIAERAMRSRKCHEAPADLGDCTLLRCP